MPFSFFVACFFVLFRSLYFWYSPNIYVNFNSLFGCFVFVWATTVCALFAFSFVSARSLFALEKLFALEQLQLISYRIFAKRERENKICHLCALLAVWLLDHSCNARGNFIISFQLSENGKWGRSEGKKARNFPNCDLIFSCKKKIKRNNNFWFSSARSCN